MIQRKISYYLLYTPGLGSIFMQLDDKDTEILSIMISDSSTTKAEIARRTGLAASVAGDRIRRLQEAGVIQAYEVRLDARVLGWPLLAFIFVRETKPNNAFDTGGALAGVTGVEEVHKISGEDCFMVKIRARGTEHLGQVLDAEINTIPTVSGVKTSIVLRTDKEGAPLSGSPLR